MAAALLLAVTALTACHSRRLGSDGTAPVLLYGGAGTSPNDVAAIESVLDLGLLRYAVVNSAQLNAMGAAEMSRYHLLIVPGGNFMEMSNGLSESTTVNIRNAVHGGMNYLGVCAGGFLAGILPAPYKSFNLSSGVSFPLYAGGPRKIVVKIRMADGTVFDQYWEEGPQFSGWGEVVGKYPDRSPAIVEGTVGRGMVILTGTHPEAPENWRRGMAFDTPVSMDTEYARMLIAHAVSGLAMPHY